MESSYPWLMGTPPLTGAIIVVLLDSLPLLFVEDPVVSCVLWFLEGKISQESFHVNQGEVAPLAVPSSAAPSS